MSALLGKPDSEVQAIKDEFLGFIRDANYKAQLQGVVTVSMWQGFVRDAFDKIHAKYGEAAALFCVMVYKEAAGQADRGGA